MAREFGGRWRTEPRLARSLERAWRGIGTNCINVGDVALGLVSGGHFAPIVLERGPLMQEGWGLREEHDRARA